MRVSRSNSTFANLAFNWRISADGSAGGIAAACVGAGLAATGGGSGILAISSCNRESLCLHLAETVLGTLDEGLALGDLDSLRATLRCTAGFLQRCIQTPCLG